MEFNPAPLSIREYKIVCLAKEGMSNKEIANHLNIEESTVKCHRRNVMRKLGLKGKVEFLRFLHSLSPQL